MEKFVDAMDLMYAGDKDADGYAFKTFDLFKIPYYLRLVIVFHGLTPSKHTIQPFIESNKHFSTVPLLLICLRTLSRLRILN